MTRPFIFARSLGLIFVVLTGCGDDGPGGTGAGGSSSDGGGGAGGAPIGGAGGTAEGGAGGAGGSSDACVEGPTLGSPECEACQNANCCVTAAECAASPECVAMHECKRLDPESTTCGEEHPDGIWYYSGVEICRRNHCSDACGLPEPVCGEIIPTPASCTDEVNEVCCDITRACGENDSCVALIYQCIDENGCSSQACLDDCYERFPDGVEDFEALVDCWGDVPCL